MCCVLLVQKNKICVVTLLVVELTTRDWNIFDVRVKW